MPGNLVDGCYADIVRLYRIVGRKVPAPGSMVPVHVPVPDRSSVLRTSTSSRAPGATEPACSPLHRFSPHTNGTTVFPFSAQPLLTAFSQQKESNLKSCSARQEMTTTGI
ncbi:hypothetical protein H0G86_003465 [Trichoderma simmonsii]|uniref:Uncharacterized protein n=1 Tax=Trichoderma simmonsii TaxID=1491479 RepID=A0A8G0L8M6_9HYPO|nr:hypothetical protein H0G86_003465 [Trichoderma simmonsii]